MQVDFQGIWVPIVTPFKSDAVDHGALAKLAQHFEAAGVKGLVAGATTGEGALLNPPEQEAIFRTLRQAAPRLPIILGLSEAATHKAVAQARFLAALRPDGILATAPSYVRPTQSGVQKHFEAIAQAVDMPVFIYNIPYRTGVTVELDTLQALARDPRIVGIKECGGSVERMMRLVHDTPLRVFSGDDNQNFSALCLGAHGTIAASAHVYPALHVQMFDLLQRGQLHEARRIAVALRPIVHDLFAEPNPAPLKGLLAWLGWCQADLRLPFVPASDALCIALQGHANDLKSLT